MAPELLRGDPGDTRSDLWSLGVLLFEMAARRLPFAGQTLYDLMTDILQRPPQLPAGAVPPDVEAVIYRCLDKDPDRRYQRGAAVRDSLTTVVTRE
jgi:serine/threonine-protein kinase